ncbi:UDP-N-acetylglucosamine 2-epimerase (non-hydrolyzing) [Micromonospora sp. NPDC049374]|uniref:non-hydrolyzing UDP-N-acetylglucosamine 2-epimerase n=1 Tax=Micromonospora sp. NPDC049374 TaxID=3154352 RepID=UPI003442F118
MPTVMLVAGTRPNFMKIKPVLDALEKRAAHVVLVHAGQHYDHAMSEVFFADLGLRAPDRHLGTGSGTVVQQTARIMTAFEPVLADIAPDAVVVVGDVTATLACALVTAHSGITLAHVEAGLRSRDWDMPEEINRVVVDRVSDLLFAPSPDAVDNLHGEGYHPHQIRLVGNVMVDTLLANLSRARESNVLARNGLKAGEFGLVTLHRPSNVDDPVALGTLMTALGEVARLLPLVMTVHPRTAKRLDASGIPTGLQLLPPAGYLDFLSLQAEARMVLTDSGGVQEETTVLGVPCLTLRESTERPITIAQGTNTLVGRDPQRIIGAATRILHTPPPRRCPALWDGRAAERIADILLDHLAAPVRNRPTDLPASGLDGTGHPANRAVARQRR